MIPERLNTTPQELKELFYALMLAGQPHIYYDKNRKAAQKYMTLVSGEGLEGLMHQFKPRESNELFAQRKQITQEIVTGVCKNVRDIEYKVPRSNSIIRTIAGDGAKAIAAILEKFWGKYSFDDYMDLRWIELNDTDPNCFIVLEWKPFKETAKAQPYPLEVYSENTWYFIERNNILELLISKFTGDYTCYGPNNTIVLKEQDDEMAKKLKGVQTKEGVEFSYGGLTYILFDKTYYEVLEPLAHNLGFVPAIQVGYMRDASTDGLTYLPPWKAAESVLMNLITAKSELDLSIALHTFPQKVQYVPRCNNKDCHSGQLPDGSTCPTCQGTGYQTLHTSSQDALTIPLPGNAEDVIDLSKLMHYFYPPVDLVKFMDEYVDKLTSRAVEFVYNSELYSRQQIAETATKHNIDLQSIYDTLFPMVKEMALQWETFIWMIGKITDINNATPSFLFSRDFKMKSMDNYYDDLSQLNEAKAAPFIISNVEDDIARLAYSEDRMALLKYFTQKFFDPFQGESEAGTQARLQDPLVPTNIKVLAANFKAIFDAIELTDPLFYEWARKKQKVRLDAEVERFRKMAEEDKAARAQEFGLPADGGGQGEGTEGNEGGQGEEGAEEGGAEEGGAGEEGTEEGAE